LIVGALIVGTPTRATTAPLRLALRHRATHFQAAFAKIVVAQFWIAAFNASCTALFLLVVLPAFDVAIPYVGALVAFTFMAGLVPTDKPTHAIFDTRSSKMVAVLAELIIPKTETPGAIEAGAPAFIEMMVADWFNDSERKIFFDGLAALDEFCKAQYQKNFMTCDETQRTAALKSAEQQASTYKSSAPAFDFSQKIVDQNTPFFTKLKELTVLGYFT